MKKLKFGLIGCGNRSYLVKYVHQLQDLSELTAACDLDPNRLLKFEQEIGHSLSKYNNIAEMLNKEQLDGVFVLSPDHLHEDHAIQILKKGIAVYLEKPMAISIDGCDRILSTAYENNAKLYLGHNMRHMPVIQMMKKIIDAGQIGEVQAAWCRHFINYGGDAYYKDWHAERKYTHSLLLQKGAHDLDVLQYLCHSSLQEVSGMGKLSVYNQIDDHRDPSTPPDITWRDENWPPLSQKGLHPKINVEDHNMVLLQMENGTQASYMQCHYTPDSCRNYTIIGTEGRIENIGDQHPGHIHLFTQRTKEYGKENEIIPIPETEGGHGGADPSIIREFIYFLKGEAQPALTPLDARNAVAAGYLATESLRGDGRRYSIPPINENLKRYFLNHQKQT